MEYNMSSALYNYMRPNENEILSLENIKLIRYFEGS